MNSLNLRQVSVGNRGPTPIPDSELERLAREEIKQFENDENGKGLQGHLTTDGDSDIITGIIFYTSALENYFQRAGGDYAKARNVVRDVLQEKVDEKGHTRMYRILSQFVTTSPFTLSIGNIAIRVKDFVHGYLAGSQDIRLYAGSQPNLVPTDSTPFITVKLKI